MVRDEAEHLTVYLADHYVIGLAKASCARRDLIKHALQIHWRA